MSCSMAELNQITGGTERIRFFDISLGGKNKAIIWSGNYVWPDGSNREINYGQGFGVLQCASWINKGNESEVKENLWWQLRFCQKKLEDAISLFERSRDEVKKRASNASVSGFQSPTIDEVKMVRRLRHECRRWESKLNELDLLINPPSEPVVISDEARKRMSENQSQAEKVLNELSKLEI